MRVAQVGVGEWGKNHARVLDQLGVLGAICDTDSERAKQAASKYDVNHYLTSDQLLDSEEFGAVLICTPTSTHAELAAKFIEQKKHVFVEGPMTYRSDEGQKLKQLAEKNRVILTCGYIERFNPTAGTIKEFIKSQKYGKLAMLEFHREDCAPPHITYAGVIHDIAVHDIDAAMWFFDGVPETVFAKAGNLRHEYEDFATIILGFGQNQFATIITNLITPTKTRNFSAVCTNGAITSNFLAQKIVVDIQGKTETIHGGKEDALLVELRTFLDAAAGKKVPVVSAEHAVNVTVIAEAALLSNEKGVPIYMDLK